MIPVSQAYRDAINAPEVNLITTVTPYRGSIASAGPLPVEDGSITIDNRNPLRTSGDITIVDATGELVPVNAQAPLMPNGTELLVSQGPILQDGTVEATPLGRLRLIGDLSNDDGLIQTTAYDLGYTVQTPLSAPYPIYAGTEVGAACAALILRKNPNLTVSVIDTGETVPFTLVDLNDDPYQTARKMANAANHEAFFDPTGAFTVAPASLTPAVVPAWEFTEGKNARFWKVNREINTDGVPSEVVVEGNHSARPTAMRVVVRDTNPESPTYADGPYGRITETIVSEKVVTLAQCQRLGEATLQRLAWIERFSFECVPIGALQPGDTVSITRARLGLFGERAIIESMTIPLKPGPMRVTAVSRRVPDTGLAT